MAIVEHGIVKPEIIAQAAAVMLEKQLVLPAVFRREGIDRFRGAHDDTINITVEGVLPWRTYGWRNDRSEPIQFDVYSERKVAVTFGGDIYNAVRLTDEQRDFDLDGWLKLARVQTEAIGKGLEALASKYVRTAPYAVTLGIDSESLRRGLIRAREVLNRLHAPKTRRVLLVGTDWETALLDDDKLSLAQNVGESEAVAALRNATIGRRYGFDIVVAQDLPPDEAIAMAGSAFVFVTGAPGIPESVPMGATASYNGIAIRWIRDYDTDYLSDRSVFNCYQGFRHVPDVLVGVDEAGDQRFVSKYEHFVRAIKLKLDGSDSLPNGDDGRPSEGFEPEQDDELARITGVGTPASDD